MKLYIDPGTGSMLFAILIGLFSALIWLFKGWMVKIKFLFSGGKSQNQSSKKLPLVIFSDDKRYWPVFEPVCRILNDRGTEVTYMTASPDDPALNHSYEHLHAEFIGEGNKAFAKLNFLQATILLSTTPGLEVYQWKRSPGVDYYVHMLHMPNDPTTYRMFGLDYYDAVLLSGEYQVRQQRKLEALRNLPAKELVLTGIPYMDEMVNRLHSESPVDQKNNKTVLLATSWGASAIFSVYGGKIIDELLKTDYHIIVRPHPQSFTSEKEMMEKLMAAYPESDRLEWNRDTDNFDCLNRSDILISDFSGIIFDFALVYDKPVITANAAFDAAPYDAWWLDEELWTFTVLPKLGATLTENDLSQLPEIIAACMENPQYAKNRQAVRDETWVHFGEGAKRVADYLLEKYDALKQREDS